MKAIYLLLMGLFIALPVYAEKVIVVYKPDKSISIIHPIIKGNMNQKKYKEVYEEATKDTELAGLPYDIIDSSEIPDSTEYAKESWEGEKGKGIIANTVKAEKIKKERERRRLIDERKDEILEGQAINSLIIDGLLEEE